MTIRLSFWLAFMLWALAAPQITAQEFSVSQESPIRDIHPEAVILWEAAQALVQKDGVIRVGLRLMTREQFSIYKDKLVIEGPRAYEVRFLTTPLPRRQPDPMGDGEIEVYDAGEFEIELRGQATPAPKTLALRITFLGCTERICLFPFTKELNIPVFPASSTLSGTESETGESSPRPQASADDREGAMSRKNEGRELGELQRSYAQQLEEGTLPLLWVFAIVLLGGLATNLTPCIFPMIPITLRLLGTQGQRPFASSLLYAAGIMASYSLLGFIAVLSGGIFASILAHPAVNVAFGLIFAFLGLSMLGFANFTALQRLGTRLGSGRGPYLNAFSMGAGAGLVGAPCTGPIMGALLAYTSKLQTPAQAMALFLTYSLGFALPYLFLGLFSRRLLRIQIGARVQLVTKIVFAGSILALGLYYLKNPAYEALLALQGLWGWLCLGFLGLGSLCLAFLFQRPMLLLKKSTHLLPAVLIAFGLFAGFQRIMGADEKPELVFLKDETEALSRAKAENKPLLVDGWAEWCVACKQMDQNAFQDPRVVNRLKSEWIVLKLDLTELTPENDALASKYGMQGLPTILLLPPDGHLEKAARYSGYLSATALLEKLTAFPRP